MKRFLFVIFGVLALFPAQASAQLCHWSSLAETSLFHPTALDPGNCGIGYTFEFDFAMQCATGGSQCVSGNLKVEWYLELASGSPCTFSQKDSHACDDPDGGSPGANCGQTSAVTYDCWGTSVGANGNYKVIVYVLESDCTTLIDSFEDYFNLNGGVWTSIADPC